MTSHYHDEAMREVESKKKDYFWSALSFGAFCRLQRLYQLLGLGSIYSFDMACSELRCADNLPPKERYHAINSACERLVG